MITEEIENEAGTVTGEESPSEVTEEEIVVEEEPEEENPEEPHKLTIEERQEQLRAQIAERNAKDAELKAREEKIIQQEQEFQKRSEDLKKPTALSEDEILKPLPMEQINSELEILDERISELKLDGKFLEAARLEKYKVEAITGIEQRLQQQQEIKTRREQQSQATIQEQQQAERIGAELQTAADEYSKAKGIDEKTGAAMSEWFINTYLPNNPIEAKIWAQKARFMPHVAIEEAVNLAKANMGKTATEAKDKRVAAKTTTINATGTISMTSKQSATEAAILKSMYPTMID
jgi:hypothetical protein